MIIKFTDIIVIFISTLIIYYLRFGDLIISREYQNILILTILVYAFQSFIIWNKSPNEVLASLREVSKFWLLSILIVTSILFFTQSSLSYSRLFFIIWISTTFLCLFSFRLLTIYLIKKMNRLKLLSKKILFIGEELFCKEIIDKLEKTGTIISDYLLIESSEIEKIGNPHINTFDEIWVLSNRLDNDSIRDIIFLLKDNTPNIRLFNRYFFSPIKNYKFSYVNNIPTLDISSTSITGVNFFIKEIEDKILATLIIVLIFPILIIIALSIKITSRGPIIYRQKRHGLNGKIFNVFKFRTMKVISEKSKFKQSNDELSRITKLGKILRKTSLDELPQFFNVLNGTMSVIGPRPHAIDHSKEFNKTITNYMWRHKIKPGITGWAQINGYRGPTINKMHMEKRVEYDLYYIENWSIYFDFIIILLTIYRGFLNK